MHEQSESVSLPHGELVLVSDATESERLQALEFRMIDTFNLPLSTGQYEIVEGILRARPMISGKHKNVKCI